MQEPYKRSIESRHLFELDDFVPSNGWHFSEHKNDKFRHHAHRRWNRFRNPRACPGESYTPTRIEQVANIVTHAVCIVPSGLGMVYLIQQSSTIWHIFTAVIYGFALIALFSASTAFHVACYIGVPDRIRFFLHICDRITIFVFTGCSYTPWLLLKEASLYVPCILVLLWMAILGAVQYQRYYHEKHKTFETMLYLIIGIVPGLICVPGMADSAGIDRLAEGGLIYVVGVLFFKSDGIIPLSHALWHLFVVLGVLWHFLAVVNHLYVPE